MTDLARQVHTVGGVVVVKDLIITGASGMISFANADTTPSVAGGSMFKTANTGATTITDFDDTRGDGHLITVFFNDSLTTVKHTAGLILLPNGVDQTFALGDWAQFLSHGGIWYGTEVRIG